MFIEIMPMAVLMYLAKRKRRAVITNRDFYEFATLVEKQSPSYRLEDFGEWECLCNIQSNRAWAPTMITLYKKVVKKDENGKRRQYYLPTDYYWDKIEVRKGHPRWEYMYNRYVPKNELENFDKAYDIFTNKKHHSHK
jgi:hypothetical protein